MNFYISERKNTQRKTGKQTITNLITLILISLIVSTPFLLFSVNVLAEDSIPVYPPEIVNVIRSPFTPNYDDLVTITAQIEEGSKEIESATLLYQIGSGNWINKTMDIQGDYVSDIPEYPYNTCVNYQIQAIDTEGNSDVSIIYSYTVTDTVAPQISNILQLPTTPNPQEPVAISAKIWEPTEGCGIKEVNLLYSTPDNPWVTLKMNTHKDKWKATVPGQNEGTDVTFAIEAIDNLENTKRTANYSYSTLIPDRSPIPVLLYQPGIANTGVNVNFDASSSYDPDGNIVSYLWDFGDGTTSTTSITSHTYPTDGEYIVTLKVTDNEGLIGSKIAIQLVKNRPPIAIFSETPTILSQQETVTFDASQSYDIDGTILEHSWNFGDGTTANGQTVTHTFSECESYRVTLTVTDNCGETDSTTSTTNVINQPPIAIFTENSETETPNEIIAFNAEESYDPDGTIVSHEWDFGDTTTATGTITTHTYQNEGNYVITLTVTDNNGATDTAKIIKNINNQQPTTITEDDQTPLIIANQHPTASFTKSNENPKTQENIQFDASSSYDPDGTITTYLWDFGDGTTAIGIAADHTYTENGAYTIVLTVTDDNMASDSSLLEVFVSNKNPIAELAVSENTITIKKNINFDASASYDTDGEIISYVWDFGDGTSATGVTADHTYTQNGKYTIELTVTDNDGDISTKSTTINVEIQSIIQFSTIPVIGLLIAAIISNLLYFFYYKPHKKRNTD